MQHVIGVQRSATASHGRHGRRQGTRSWSSCSSPGGNDFMNTLIPFTEGIYYDTRPLVARPRGPGAADHGHPRLPPRGRAPARAVPRRARGHRAGDRLRELQPLPLPGDGHLAHLRAGEGRHRGLAGQGRPRARSAGREPPDRRQLRAGAAPRPGRARRAGDLGGQPGHLRPAQRDRGARPAPAGPRGLQADVHPGRRGRAGGRLPAPDRPGRARRAPSCSRWRSQRYQSDVQYAGQRHRPQACATWPGCTPPGWGRASSTPSTGATTTTPRSCPATTGCWAS